MTKQDLVIRKQMVPLLCNLLARGKMPLAPSGPDLNIIDLEAYTLASEEAINVKFEAFESHMEEKMRSLFAKFSMDKPSSLKKSQ
ncbi:hypothetical protein B296_00033331 [Ensete ventricosum]|uniref:Uncharacterized protein n=1 Tax=Ensete ventricosum TaxID=4639 RepID=A0A426YFD8_ENSVE|nr:hypothetical protein B296_00033331 [Ensete ventricosum]